jgi:hypothetical protein
MIQSYDATLAIIQDALNGNSNRERNKQKGTGNPTSNIPIASLQAVVSEHVH